MQADRPPPPANGFTLLELLVALSVFAIAALALLQMEGASIARTADLDQRLLREIVAQNMAAEILTDPAPPAIGSASGRIENAGRQFQWTRTVAARPEYGALAIALSVREVTPGAQSQAFTLDFTRLPGT
ncbi:MAG: type II secretion system minor pseudopilin GspI [Novosphingobium sp.]|nr:type II secretion system minor pseudopilin GspI [Novosphingobium sp.]